MIARHVSKFASRWGARCSLTLRSQNTLPLVEVAQPRCNTLFVVPIGATSVALGCAMWGPSFFVAKNAETVQTFSKDDSIVQTTLCKDDNIDDNAASSMYALYVLRAVFCWLSDLFMLCAYQRSTYEITLRKLKLLLDTVSYSENHELGNQVRKALASLDDEYRLHMTDQFRCVLRGALKQRDVCDASLGGLRLALNWELFKVQPLRYLWNENKMAAMYGLVFTGALAVKSMVFFGKQRNAPYGWTTLGHALHSSKFVGSTFAWIVWLNFYNYSSNVWMYNEDESEVEE
jgi:hypothetical protein